MLPMLAADLYLETPTGCLTRLLTWCGRRCRRPGTSVRRRRSARSVTAKTAQPTGAVVASSVRRGEYTQLVLGRPRRAVDLVVSGSGGLSQLGAFFDRLQQTHDQRCGNWSQLDPRFSEYVAMMLADATTV